MGAIRSGVIAISLLGLAIVPSLADAFQYDDIPYDKRQHLEAGAAIGASITVVTQNYAFGSLTACAAGSAKEFYDLNTPGREADFADFVYTCAAGALLAYSLSEFHVGFNGDAAIINVSFDW